MGKGNEYEDDPGRRDDENMSVGRYIATRIPTLKPPMHKIPSPFALLALLNKQQWMFFLIGFLGWTWDSFDFFTVSLTVEDLATTFNKTNKQITWGITLVLMMRTVGAIFFGLWADRYGRKWPFCFCLFMFIVLELGTGFCQTYSQFLGIRAIYGISMGGLYGNAAATALEDCPAPARGIISGMMQQGYPVGYLLATAFARGLVDTTSHGWRPLFWFGACPPILLIAFRLCLPETKTFIERQKVRAASDNVGKTFISEGKVALKKHWLVLIYLVLLMAGLNFMSHATQDLYPTMLKNQYKFDANQVTVTEVIANVGAWLGGTTVGYSSQCFGRRFSILCVTIIGGLLLYPYTFTSSTAVTAPAFFEQFCVQGALGVIPIHLMELSPGSFRTFTVGTSYQLGNLISSASSTIEATLGERFPLPPLIKSDGKVTARFSYGKVICIFVGCIDLYVILLAIIGPEKLGKNLDVHVDNDMREVVPAVLGREGREGSGSGSGSGSEEVKVGTVHESIEGEKIA